LKYKFKENDVYYCLDTGAYIKIAFNEYYNGLAGEVEIPPKKPDIYTWKMGLFWDFEQSPIDYIRVVSLHDMQDLNLERILLNNH
jgi:hypothetical protein